MSKRVNWQGLKAGDRVRITLEARVVSNIASHRRIDLLLDGESSDYHNSIRSPTLNHPTTIIEKLTNPICLGDTVGTLEGRGPYTVVAMSGTQAWVRVSDDDHMTCDVEKLVPYEFVPKRSCSRIADQQQTETPQ